MIDSKIAIIEEIIVVNWMSYRILCTMEKNYSKVDKMSTGAAHKIHWENSELIKNWWFFVFEDWLILIILWPQSSLKYMPNSYVCFYF